jgi:putative peptidoglycan lipid II flippase
LISAVERVTLTNRLLARAGVAIAAAAALTAVAGFTKELLVARQFGASGELDAYLIALTAVTFLPTTLAAVLQGTFVPVFMAARQRSEHHAWVFANSVLLLVSAGLLASMLLLLLVSPLWLSLLAPGFDTAGRARVLHTTLLLLPLVWLTGLNELLKSLLNALKSFALPAGSQILPSITAAAGVLALSPQLGIGALALGWLAGVIAQTGVLVCLCLARAVPFSPRVRLRGAHLGNLTRLGLPYVVVALLPLGFLIVDQHLASKMGPGSISVLNYADKIFRLPLTILIAAVYTSVHPFFAEAAAQSRYDEFSRLFTRMFRTALFVLLPIGLTISVLREPIITLVYQRGAFGTSAVTATGGVLLFLGFFVPALGIWYVYDRALTSLRQTGPLMVLAGLTLGLKYALSLLFQARLGLSGLPLATVVTFIVAVIGMHLVLRKQLPQTTAIVPASALVRIVIASLAASGVALVIWSGSSGNGLPQSPLLLRLVLTLVVSGVAYIAAGRILGLQEVRLLGAALRPRSNHVEHRS